MEEKALATENEPAAVLMAVPEEAVDELVAAGLAQVIPTIRGPVLEAVATIGSNAAILVTLLQAPQSIRAFAAWIVSWAGRRTEGIQVSARKGARRIELTVDGDIPVEAVAEFLVAALKGSSTAPPEPELE
jgi:hypothetical protein